MTLPWEAHAIMWPALIAVGFILAYGLFGKEAWVSYRIIARFLLTIAFPLAVVVGGMLWALSALTNFPSSIWQALIAGATLATGWLTTSIFTELGRRNDKDERLRDYHKALFAEIRHTLDAFYADGTSDDMVRDIISRMNDDAGFVPFIPQERHDRVYSALVEGIEVLPRQTIDAVVAYYSVISALGDFAQDMRGASFKLLSQERRVAMFEDYAAMRLRAYHYGSYALSLIKAYSDGGPKAADAMAAQKNRAYVKGSGGATTDLNIPDADHRDHPDQGTE